MVNFLLFENELLSLDAAYVKTMHPVLRNVLVSFSMIPEEFSCYGM